MRHAVVERVPEVPGAVGFGGWHAEVVDAAGEIRLARYTDGNCIRYDLAAVCRAAVVALGFMVSRAYHVELHGC